MKPMTIKIEDNPYLKPYGHRVKLKYKYMNEVASEVKTYKMSKEELDEYLKKYEKKK